MAFDFNKGTKFDFSMGSIVEDTPVPAAQSSGGLWGTLKGVGNALISSEKALGGTISGIIQSRKGGELDQFVKLHEENQGQQVALIRSIREKKSRGEDVTADEMFLSNLQKQGKDLEANIKTITDETGKSNMQVLGEIGGTALDLLTAGTYSTAVKGAKTGSLLMKTANVAKEPVKALTKEGIKLAAKKTLKGAGIGYGYDVVTDLKEGKTVSEALTPGLGTAIGGGLPVVGYMAKLTKELVQGQASRVINSLIKPLSKDFSYGKNPGRAVAAEKITANSFDDLATKINERKSEIGAQLGEETKNIVQKSNIDYTKTLKPIDDAIKAAEVAPRVNAGLIERLKATRDDLSDIIRQTKANAQGAIQVKQQIGNLTKWTGAASDDKAVNKALKMAYGATKDELYRVIKEVDPAKEKMIRKLSERYADLISAEVATKYRDIITQRHNLISMPLKIGGIVGTIGAVASGGLSVPVFLAAGAAGLVDKALSSPAAKTRIAKWISSESPVLVAETIRKNPKIFQSLRPLLTPSLIKLIEYGKTE